MTVWHIWPLCAKETCNTSLKVQIHRKCSTGLSAASLHLQVSAELVVEVCWHPAAAVSVGASPAGHSSSLADSKQTLSQESSLLPLSLWEVQIFFFPFNYLSLLIKIVFFQPGLNIHIPFSRLWSASSSRVII